MSKYAVIIAVVVVSLTLFTSGCGWDGTNRTSAEISRDQGNTLDVGLKELNDDINGPLLHADEPSKLSENYIR